MQDSEAISDTTLVDAFIGKNWSFNEYGLLVEG
jgi:hypothetical protein